MDAGLRESRPSGPPATFGSARGPSPGRDGDIRLVMHAARPAGDSTNLISIGETADLHCAERAPMVSLKLVARGSADYTTSHLRYRVHGGSYLLLGDDTPYVLDIHAARPVETLAVFFRADLVASAWSSRSSDEARLLDDPLARGPGPIPITTGLRLGSDPMGAALHALHRRTRSGVLDDALLSDAIHLLADRVVDLCVEAQHVASSLGAVRNATRSELLRRVRRAHDFIDSSFTEPIDLAEMARVACLSPHHFHRTFARAFGETPHQYLSRRRLDRAKFLLSTTDAAVSDVCMEVGFVSLGSFSATFRKRFGAPPSAFRRPVRPARGARVERSSAEARTL